METKNIAEVTTKILEPGDYFLVTKSGKLYRVTLTVPTKLSDLTNDTGFITNDVNDLVNYYLKTETYTKSEVNALVDASVSFVVASSLPTASASTMKKIYLIPSSDPQTQNVKDEFITIHENSAYSWEKIGSTAVNLTNYYTKTESDGRFVAKESGKGLSSNDYTTAEKTKLDGIEAGAEVNPDDYLAYSVQTLTDAQKTQARTNISACAMQEYDSTAASYAENTFFYVVD